MLSLTDARKLLKLLEQAQRVAGEHAAEQAWRADAMHAIKERLVEVYHRNQAADACELIDKLRATRDDLAARIDLEDNRRRAARRPRAVA